MGLPAAAFSPDDPEADYFVNTVFMNINAPAPGSSTNRFFASVNLPQGAVVTEFRAVVEDSQGAGNLGVRLLRHPSLAGPGNPQLMADVGTNGNSSGEQVLTDSTISFATIDNAVHNYLVEVSAQDANLSGAFRLFNVRIVYTTTTVIN